MGKIVFTLESGARGQMSRRLVICNPTDLTSDRTRYCQVGTTAASLASLGGIWAVDGGHLSKSPADKQRRKKTDRTAVYEPINWTRELYSLHYAALACSEDDLKTFQFSLSLYGQFSLLSPGNS